VEFTGPGIHGFDRPGAAKKNPRRAGNLDILTDLPAATAAGFATRT
jgi:acetaldehyde dehydrogenase (acetylating)